MARPTSTPNVTPFITFTPLPTPTARTGIYNDCARQQDLLNGTTFTIGNCWYTVQDDTVIEVGVGAFDENDDPAVTQWCGGLVIFTNPVNNRNAVTISPIYWTPMNGGFTNVIQANGLMLTLRAKDGNIFTFDVVTHTWGATDVLSNIGLDGTIATGALTITLPRRLQLVFDAAHKWQASTWYDVASDPTLSLARTDGAALNYNGI